MKKLIKSRYLICSGIHKFYEQTTNLDPPAYKKATFLPHMLNILLGAYLCQCIDQNIQEQWFTSADIHPVNISPSSIASNI